MNAALAAMLNAQSLGDAADIGIRWGWGVLGLHSCAALPIVCEHRLHYLRKGSASPNGLLKTYLFWWAFCAVPEHA